MAQRDWAQWHRDYDDAASLLSRRGEVVQGHLHAELERAPAGDIRLISLCAGQGRDVIGVLAVVTLNLVKMRPRGTYVIFLSFHSTLQVISLVNVGAEITNSTSEIRI